MMRTYQVRMSMKEMQQLAVRGKSMSASNAIRHGLGFPLLRRGGVPKAKVAAK